MSKNGKILKRYKFQVVSALYGAESEGRRGQKIGFGISVISQPIKIK